VNGAFGHSNRCDAVGASNAVQEWRRAGRGGRTTPRRQRHSRTMSSVPSHQWAGWGSQGAYLGRVILDDLANRRLTYIDHGAATKVIRRDLRIHRRLPPRSFGCLACGALPEANPPELGATLRDSTHPVGVFARIRVRARAVCVIGVSSWPFAACVQVHDPRWSESSECAERKARSSFNASMLTCAGPSDIAAQAAASHIQAGNSRDMPERTSR
jgi:hypothetical protein